MDALDRAHARILREAAHGRLPVQEVNHCHGSGKGHPCTGLRSADPNRVEPGSGVMAWGSTDQKNAYLRKKARRAPARQRNFVTDKLILHREAADTLDEEYDRILEVWSDAARLASAAARRAKAHGQNWRKAGRMAAQAHRGLFGARPPNWAQQPLGAPETRRRALKRLNKRTKNATLHTTATEITRDRERRARRFTDMSHPSFPSLKRKVRNFFRRS